MVYSIRRFVLCLALCYFFFSPFSIAITSLGEERPGLGAFRMFVRFALIWFYPFPLPLGVWEGLFSYPFFSDDCQQYFNYIILTVSGCDGGNWYNFIVPPECSNIIPRQINDTAACQIKPTLNRSLSSSIKRGRLETETITSRTECRRSTNGTIRTGPTHRGLKFTLKPSAGLIEKSI